MHRGEEKRNIKNMKIILKKDLTNKVWYGNMIKLLERQRYAAVAQLDRVFGYEPKGRGFESLQPYQKRRSPKGGLRFCFLLT